MSERPNVDLGLAKWFGSPVKFTHFAAHTPAPGATSDHGKQCLGTPTWMTIKGSQHQAPPEANQATTFVAPLEANKPAPMTSPAANLADFTANAQDPMQMAPLSATQCNQEEETGGVCGPVRYGFAS
jgi:hypothetical protein